MPFTPTHILAVIPIALCVRTLSISGLAIGSLIPDFPLFFPVVSYSYTHSLAGLFMFCIPAGLCVYWMYQLSIKRLLVDISPNWYRIRLSRYKQNVTPRTLPAFILLCVSVFVGAATHVFWDTFTHSGSWGTQYFSSLLQQSNLFGSELPWYKLIQYGSTLIGLPLLLLIGHLTVQKIKPDLDVNQLESHRSLFCVFCVLLILIPAMLLIIHMDKISNLSNLFGAVLKQSIAVSIIVVLLLSFLHHFNEVKKGHGEKYKFQ